MNIEIAAVGGWGECGRNMTAVKIGESVVILDMGLHLPNYIQLTEHEMDNTVRNSIKALQEANAIPIDTMIEKWRKKVVAIVTTHAHLDHVGAIPRLAKKYRAPILATPYSAAIMRAICQDEQLTIPNKIAEMKPGKMKKINKDVEIEFVRTTHSTLQTVIVVLHTPKGAIVYGNDYKLDNNPTYGDPPDYERLKQIGEHGVIALIQDCIYAGNPRKTPSENIAREKLWEVLSSIDKNAGIIVTTFASHVVRLKTLTEFGKRIGRKVVFLSRSMSKYTEAAKDAKLIDLTTKAEVIRYARQIRKKLRAIQKEGKHQYLVVVSGHQGEPQSVLSKMVAHDLYPWNFQGDHVVFSSHTIPAEINRKNVAVLDAKLERRGAHIYKDVHVSGHSSREDMREIINLVKPKHLFPAHGDEEMMDAFKELAEEMGYEEGRNVHLMHNGDIKLLN